VRTPEQDWSASVRMRKNGQDIAQHDAVNPANGAYPTSQWSAGEVVGDAYGFALPPGVTPDKLTVILYRQAEDGSFANLDVAAFPLPAPQ
jgi:hypothetical protein